MLVSGWRLPRRYPNQLLVDELLDAHVAELASVTGVLDAAKGELRVRAPPHRGSRSETARSAAGSPPLSAPSAAVGSPSERPLITKGGRSRDQEPGISRGSRASSCPRIPCRMATFRAVGGPRLRRLRTERRPPGGGRNSEKCRSGRSVPTRPFDRDWIYKSRNHTPPLAPDVRGAACFSSSLTNQSCANRATARSIGSRSVSVAEWGESARDRLDGAQQVVVGRVRVARCGAEALVPREALGEADVLRRPVEVCVRRCDETRERSG